jgi:hypothetical protein
MEQMRKQNLLRALIFCVCALNFSAPRAMAFALLGPYESWMVETNDFRQPGDIGGPMDIGNGYRWNVPVVTYGFDKSFLDFFGTNGVAAVESAIQVLNDLPPASQIVLTNYPLDTEQINYQAQAQSLYDLKSATLVLLLEQMGLAQPTRYVFTLKQWDPIFLVDQNLPSWPDGTIPNDIVLRNFDPETFTNSFYVNGSWFTAFVYSSAILNDALEIPVDPINETLSVADYSLNLGPFSGGNYIVGKLFAGLTKDDVGGLRYLLSTNNVAYETLLPDTYSAGADPYLLVNGAWRPGVDKVTFVPLRVDPLNGAFLPMIDRYTDTYITNGILVQQQVERLVKQPDFLFCAGDVNYGVPAIPFVDRTGTTNWINNATLNGNSTGAGPGIIQPQVKITFNKLGHVFENLNDTSAEDSPRFWGTFDSSTNAPIVYPVSQTGTNQFTIRMWLNLPSQFQKNFDWSLTNSTGSVALFQTSTNLADWVTIFSATNDGTIWTFENMNPSSSSRFYRVVPQ